MTSSFTRRNFLLGVRNAGILVLMPPGLTAVQLKEEQRLLAESKGPELFCGRMKGVADGPVIRSNMPEPDSLSVNAFTFTAFTHTTDLTPIGAHYRARVPTLADYCIEAWIRSERENMFSYVGETVFISAQVSESVFYSGNFIITEVRYEDENL